MSTKKERIEVPRVSAKPKQKIRFSAINKKPIESQKARLSATNKPIIDSQKPRLSAKGKQITESPYHRSSVGPKFKLKNEIKTKLDSVIYESGLIRKSNLSKTRESSKNDNKLNQTTIIEPKQLKLDKKEIKVKTGLKSKNLPLNTSNSNSHLKSTSQLKISLIDLKRELKEKEELNKNLQIKIKENENVISDLNNQVLNIRSQLAQRDANDLFEMDNLMEKISSMENEKSEQDKRIKLLSEQVSNYTSDIRKSVSANEKLKIDIER